MKIKSELKINLFPDGYFIQEQEIPDEILAPLNSEPEIAREIMRVELLVAIERAIYHARTILANPAYRKYRGLPIQRET